jgi:quercetin dioxygenase-like cupin family protein
MHSASPLFGVLAILAAPALAQTAAPAAEAPAMLKTFASSADVEALIAKAKAAHKPGQLLVNETIVRLPPYTASLAYRVGAELPMVHEKQAELYYVLEGTGTITTGGSMLNPRRLNGGNLEGSAIEGGTSRVLSKGDFFFVPENTPHGWTAIPDSMVTMSLHLPRPTAPQ